MPGMLSEISGMKGDVMRNLAVIVSLVLCLVSLAEKAALSKDTSIVLELGAAKVSGDLYEDTTYRMISGIGVFYTVTSRIQLGFQGRYVEWTPDKVEALPGSDRIIYGSIQNVELVGLLRIQEEADKLTFFGEFGLGYSILDSSADVYSRPVVPDPGPYSYLYTIESQNKPIVRLGIGMTYQITTSIGIEANGRYGYIFTEDKSTKYISFSGGLAVLIF
jgi:hypothetical protein